MSRIIFADGVKGAPFGLYSIGALVVNGSLKVSWATGTKASTKMLYSAGDDHLGQTLGPVLLQPGDEGYIPGQQTKRLVRFHELAFPTTFADSYHYFKVSSQDPATGKTLQSAVYSIYITDKFELENLFYIQAPRVKQVSFAPSQTAGTALAASIAITFNAGKVAEALPARFKGTKPVANAPIFRAAATTTEVIEIQTTVEPIP